jgi:ribonuclease J
MEATRMGEEPAAMLTEDEVIEEMVRAGAAVSGLVMVLPYPRNVERIRRLPEVAHRMGRRLVMEAGIAALLAEDSARSPDQQASSARAEVLTDALVAQIRSDPRSFVVQLSYAGLATLLDLQPPPGSLLVHSDGEPLGAYDPATANLQRWLERFAAGYRVVRSSGHAAPAELLQMVAEIGPQALIPLHGLRPELLSAPGVRQVLPLPDVPYGLDGAPLQG